MGAEFSKSQHEQQELKNKQESEGRTLNIERSEASENDSDKEKSVELDKATFGESSSEVKDNELEQFKQQLEASAESRWADAPEVDDRDIPDPPPLPEPSPESPEPPPLPRPEPPPLPKPL